MDKNQIRVLSDNGKDVRITIHNEELLRQLNGVAGSTHIQSEDIHLIQCFKRKEL